MSSLKALLSCLFFVPLMLNFTSVHAQSADSKFHLGVNLGYSDLSGIGNSSGRFLGEWYPTIAAEVGYHVVDRLSIFSQIRYQNFSYDAGTTESVWQSITFIINHHARLRTIPLALGIEYAAPVTKGGNIHLNMRMTGEYQFLAYRLNSGRTSSRSEEASKNVPALAVAAGPEWRLSPGFSLGGYAGYRWLNIDSLEFSNNIMPLTAISLNLDGWFVESSLRLHF